MRQLYLAATGQNRGKTTAALGLFDGFVRKGLNAGFMKPVGQRTVIDDGEPADEDAVLMRTTEVGSNAKTNEVKRDADLCLRPPIDQYGVLEFEAIDRIVDVGYRYAQEKLESLRDDPALAGIFGNPPGSDVPVPAQ